LIPQNITREHIIKAIEEAERQDIPKARLTYRNYLEYNSKHYPPKYIVCLANKYANERELNAAELYSKESRLFLKSLGFNVLKSAEDKTEVDDLDNQSYELEEEYQVLSAADIELSLHSFPDNKEQKIIITNANTV